MINIKDPRQRPLFDPFEHLFSPLAYKTIKKGWQGVFRHVILKLLPAQTVAGEFHPVMGRPTKELYRPSEHQLFGDAAKDKESRQLLRQQVATSAIPQTACESDADAAEACARRPQGVRTAGRGDVCGHAVRQR